MDLVSARRNMVDSQVRTSDVTNTAIHDAMLAVPRERLCAPGWSFAAYADAKAPIAAGRSLTPAREVGKLLQALAPRPGERALCVAAPYAAAVLAHIGLDVVAQEADESVAAVIRPVLSEAGVTVQVAPLDQPVGGDWDILVSEGGVIEAPEAWVQALKSGGRMVVIERQGPVGVARLMVRTGGGATSRLELFDAAPDMLAGLDKRPTFQF
ncbi:protein-L-isoaspartate O-methyltransferase [Brevundimonas sp.]|uniref:protein-L-isoaspartate O-methyltransferase family protein n=1 Tax=Brevundimonas sp. TaxID=1871086 RepID=UPI0025D018AA|nr:protein-L-isoaspartate O-methyltransferase [Brevundimonas sp.]